MSNDPTPVAPAAAGADERPSPALPPAAPAKVAPTGWVIAAVILFWPTAIPAVLAAIRSARADGAQDPVTAADEAAKAKRWSIVSVCVAAALIVVSVVVSVLWTVLVAVAWHGGQRGGAVLERDGMMNEQPWDRRGWGADPESNS